MKPLFRFFLATALWAVVFTATPAFADLSITATGVFSSEGATCKYVSGIAGEAITAGQAVYYDSSSGQNNYKLADADSATKYKVIGLVLNGAATGQKVRICTFDPSFTIGATMVIGDTVWLSTTPGGLTKVSTEGVATGSYVACIGVAISTTKIALNITRAGAVKP